jgi:hypothetical protein
MTAAASSTSPWSEPTGSDHNAARALADAEQQAADRRRAVRAVAGAAADTRDARLLMDILGLDHADILAAADDPASARRPRRHRAA